MKYKIYVILLTLFSIARKTEWWYQNLILDSNMNISIDFILTYISLVILYLLYKSNEKYKFLLILILIINMLLMIIHARVHIGWLHVLD